MDKKRKLRDIVKGAPEGRIISASGIARHAAKKFRVKVWPDEVVRIFVEEGLRRVTDKDGRLQYGFCKTEFIKTRGGDALGWDPGRGTIVARGPGGSTVPASGLRVQPVSFQPIGPRHSVRPSVRPPEARPVARPDGQNGGFKADFLALIEGVEGLHALTQRLGFPIRIVITPETYDIGPATEEQIEEKAGEGGEAHAGTNGSAGAAVTMRL